MNKQGVLFRESTEVQPGSLASNALIVVFTSFSYALFAYGLKLKKNISIFEIMVITAVFALFFSPFFSTFRLESTSRENWAPSWANYLVYFGCGAFVAAILRIFSSNPNQGNSEQRAETAVESNSSA